MDAIILAERERIGSDLKAELEETKEDLREVQKRLEKAVGPSEELLEQKEYIEQRVEMGEQRRAKARAILEEVKK